MCKQSAWCKDASDTYTIDLDKILSLLIDQCKAGTDAVTPGVVSLAFVLLKTKDSPELHTIAVNFLEQFLKKRYMFGPGIVKEIVNLMIVNQECSQYVGETVMTGIKDDIQLIKISFFIRMPDNIEP